MSLCVLLVAIRQEIKDIEDGKYDQKNNLLKVGGFTDIFMLMSRPMWIFVGIIVCHFVYADMLCVIFPIMKHFTEHKLVFSFSFW